MINTCLNSRKREKRLQDIADAFITKKNTYEIQIYEFLILKTMAIIRQVRQNSSTLKWAYVEYSDENKYHFQILGGKEFNTMEEAQEYSKGFDLESYEWIDPEELKQNRLLKEKEMLQNRIDVIDKTVRYEK